MCLGVIAILLLNVMDVFSVCGGAILDRPCIVFQRVCVLCMWSQWASKCSFHMLCFCMSEVISSFRSLRAGSQVFALLMLFLCVLLHTMYSGKSLQVLCLALWLGCLCLVLCCPSCWWHLLLVVLCGHQCTSAREWSAFTSPGRTECVLYAVLYVRVTCFVVRGCGVSRRYIDVWYCDMFSVVNVC